jgi:hypothetical protein
MSTRLLKDCAAKVRGPRAEVRSRAKVSGERPFGLKPFDLSSDL